MSLADSCSEDYFPVGWSHETVVDSEKNWLEMKVDSYPIEVSEDFELVLLSTFEDHKPRVDLEPPLYAASEIQMRNTNISNAVLIYCVSFLQT